jgi:hypothetical protein
MRWRLRGGDTLAATTSLTAEMIFNPFLSRGGAGWRAKRGRRAIIPREGPQGPSTRNGNILSWNSMKKVLPLAVGELEGLPLVNLSRFSIKEKYVRYNQSEQAFESAKSCRIKSNRASIYKYVFLIFYLHQSLTIPFLLLFTLSMILSCYPLTSCVLRAASFNFRPGYRSLSSLRPARIPTLPRVTEPRGRAGSVHSFSQSRAT